MILPFLFFGEKEEDNLNIIGDNQFTNNMSEWSTFKYFTFNYNLIFQHYNEHATLILKVYYYKMIQFKAAWSDCILCNIIYTSIQLEYMYAVNP